MHQKVNKLISKWVNKLLKKITYVKLVLLGKIFIHLIDLITYLLINFKNLLPYYLQKRKDIINGN